MDGSFLLLFHVLPRAHRCCDYFPTLRLPPLGASGIRDMYPGVLYYCDGPNSPASICSVKCKSQCPCSFYPLCALQCFRAQLVKIQAQCKAPLFHRNTEPWMLPDTRHRQGWSTVTEGVGDVRQGGPHRYSQES